MKKGIIVLLIAVLVAGFAFADVTKYEGSAQVDYVVGLNKGDEFGFKNKTSTTFKFSFEFVAGKKDIADHETDFWAELAAEATIGYNDVQAADGGKGITYTAKITKADIHVKDLTINILGPHAAYNYASSFRKDDKKDPVYDWANNKKFEYTVGGVELKYAGYSLSFAQYKTNTAAKDGKEAGLGNLTYIKKTKYDAMTPEQKAGYYLFTDDGEYLLVAPKTKAVDPTAAKETLTIFVGGETKAFEFGEGLTLQAAANGLLSGDKNAEGKYQLAKKAGAAVKFNYKAEKANAGIAVDADYGAATFMMDVSVTGGYDFVSGGAYFGLEKKKDVANVKMVLEAFAKAAIPAGDYKINLYAEADRLLVAKRDASSKLFDEKFAGFTVKADTTINALTVACYFNFNQVVDTATSASGLDMKLWGMNAGVDGTYKAEKFTVKVGAALNFGEKNKALAACSIKPTASISSDALVENCTLSVAWSNARIVLDETVAQPEFKKDNGKITTTAKIAF